MKAIISNKIYMKLPSTGEAKDIMSKLTYKIRKKGAVGGFEKIETIRNYALVNPDVLVIPQGRQDLIPEYYTVEDRRVFNRVPFTEPIYSLRDDQLEVYNQVTDSLFLNAKPGWGKTFTALHIAKKLGQKTLVVTHNTFLRKQWVDEASKLFQYDVGVIGSSKFDMEDHFVVVANSQTLVKHLDKVAKEFGTIILDEAHHAPATTFTEIVNSSHARYRLALSGTMERLDGKHVMFPDVFGPKVISPESTNTIPPEVHLLNTGFSLPSGNDWASTMNLLMYDSEYQKLVATVCQTYARLGHKILVTADRVEFLEKLAELLGPRAVLITGSIGDRDTLESSLEANKYDYVVGSRSMFTEGISINILSCLVMPQPSGNEILLEQLSARVMRKHENKLDPVLVDIRLKGGAANKQNSDRLGFYTKMGWKVNFI